MKPVTKINKRADYFVYSEGEEYKEMDMLTTFRAIMHDKKWVIEPDQESVSGTGSSITQTRKALKILTEVIKRYDVSSLLDIPCGDFNWMRKLKFNDLDYTGGDIVPEIIDANHREYSNEHIDFSIMDIVKGPLPMRDLLFCRDCLVHFSFVDISKALKQISLSGSKFLLMTTFPEEVKNHDLITGGWRPLNFESPPFNFPKPITVFNEGCTEMNGLFNDKSLGLWEISKMNLG